MTESERKENIIKLVQELLLNEATEERESQISLEIDALSLDPAWSDYIYWGKGKYDNRDGSLNIEKFLDKIFSCKPNIL